MKCDIIEDGRLFDSRSSQSQTVKVSEQVETL